MATPRVGPQYHRVQSWFFESLKLLRDQLDPEAMLGASGSASASPEFRRMLHELGLTDVPRETVQVLDEAIEALSPMEGLFAGPYGQEIRLIHIAEAVRHASRAAAMLPEELLAQRRMLSLKRLPEAADDLAVRVGRGFRRRTSDRLRGLCVVLDPAVVGGRDLLRLAEESLAGGATALRLRDGTGAKRDAGDLALRLMELCARHEATLVLDDHADLAVAVEADALHTGPRSLSVAQARAVLRPWQAAGSSASTPSDVEESYRQGADYITMGPVFPPADRPDRGRVELDILRRAREIVPADGPPLVAAGGITAANAAEVARAGVDGISVTRSVLKAEDPRRAAAELVEAFRRAKS